MKRALEIVYAATLPKASKPFLYMSIVLPPEHVDVNVHPTKREVYVVTSIFCVFPCLNAWRVARKVLMYEMYFCALP